VNRAEPGSSGGINLFLRMRSKRTLHCLVMWQKQALYGELSTGDRSACGASCDNNKATCKMRGAWRLESQTASPQLLRVANIFNAQSL
jgi:hypothetical protein